MLGVERLGKEGSVVKRCEQFVLGGGRREALFKGGKGLESEDGGLSSSITPVHTASLLKPIHRRRDPFFGHLGA